MSNDISEMKEAVALLQKAEDLIEQAIFIGKNAIDRHRLIELLKAVRMVDRVLVHTKNSIP